MANETPTIKCSRSGRVLTPLSLDYWRVKKTLKTILSSESDDEQPSTPVNRRKKRTATGSNSEEDDSHQKNNLTPLRNDHKTPTSTKRDVRHTNKENRQITLSTEIPKTSIQVTRRRPKTPQTAVSSKTENDQVSRDLPMDAASKASTRDFDGKLTTTPKSVQSGLPVGRAQIKPVYRNRREDNFTKTRCADEDSDSSDSIDRHPEQVLNVSIVPKENYEATSAADLTRSIIHAPRKRAVKMRIESSSTSDAEDEQRVIDATESHLAETDQLTTRLAVTTLSDSDRISSADCDRKINIANEGHSREVIVITSEDDSPNCDSDIKTLNQKSTKTTNESRTNSPSPVTPTHSQNPFIAPATRQMPVTEPRKVALKTTDRKQMPATEKSRKTRPMRGRQHSSSDDDSFEILLDKLRFCKQESNAFDETQLDPNITDVQWENLNKDNRHFLASLSEDSSIEEVHPDALHYRKRNFTSIRDELTERLYELFHRTVFQSRFIEGIPVTWNSRLLTTAGWCFCKKRPDGTKISRIELSTKVVDRADRLRDTLIHEMCHAGAWIIHGYNGGHGPLFKFWGQRATEHLGLTVTTCHSYTIEKKFTYRCEQCGYEVGRHSKSLDTRQYVCAHCKGRFRLTAK